MASPAWHYVFKFIITGDAAVGKSSLLVRLTDQRFLANPDPTLGVEFGSKLLEIPEEGKIVKLQCWDTAGTESFRSITRSYYRGAAGCLLVYDVTSRASFEHLRSWLADVRAHADPQLSCILVGNKTDLCGEEPEPEPAPTRSPGAGDSAAAATDPPAPSAATALATPAPAAGLKARAVPRTEAAAWADSEGLLFVEASAKSGAGVERAFVEACRDILHKVRDGKFDDGRSPGVKPGAAAKGQVELGRKEAKGGCC